MTQSENWNFIRFRWEMQLACNPRARRVALRNSYREKWRRKYGEPVIEIFLLKILVTKIRENMKNLRRHTKRMAELNAPYGTTKCLMMVFLL